MQKLLADRRVLLPVIATAVVIAVGATLIVLLSGDASGAATGAVPAQSQSATGSAVTIDIADFMFKPASVTVKAGTKVTWINHDASPHTATSSGSEAFDTGTLKKGRQKTLTLKKAGTYAYICEFHPFMKGTVIVR